MVDLMITEWEGIGRLLIALGLGLAIGAERTARGGNVGLRTYGLIALGASVFVVASLLVSQEYVDATNFDPLRVAAQIVVGVGFLGAGVIYTNATNVTRGLTTAAGMWVAAAIGMAAGFGLYTVAAATTIFVIFTFSTLQTIEYRYLKKINKDNN